MKFDLEKSVHSTMDGSALGLRSKRFGGQAGGNNSAFCILHSAFLSAFTMVEMVIAVGLFCLVVAGSLGVYVMCQKFWQATTLNMQTSQMAEMALSRMIFGVGTNAGLREASSLVFYCYPSNVASSAYLHSHLSPATYTYWIKSTMTPPAAADTRLNFSCSYATYNDGGSWRLMYSNATCGAQYIEYNHPFQTLSRGTNNNSRIILATYVTNAIVATNDQGVEITITVARQIGSLVSTSAVSAYVKLRNKI